MNRDDVIWKVSEHATVQMDTFEFENVRKKGFVVLDGLTRSGDKLVSMFQANMVAVLATSKTDRHVRAIAVVDRYTHLPHGMTEDEIKGLAIDLVEDAVLEKLTVDTSA